MYWITATDNQGTRKRSQPVCMLQIHVLLVKFSFTGDIITLPLAYSEALLVLLARDLVQ